MNLFAIAGLSVAISCAVLSLITFIFGRTKLHRLLLNFNLVLAFYGSCIFWVGVTGSETQAINAWKGAFFFGFFIAPCFFHMVRHFCEKMPGKLQYFIYLQGAFFSFACIGTDLMINKVRSFSGLQYNIATPLFAAGILCYLITVIISYFELFRFLRKSRGHKRLQAQYIVYGFLIGFVGGTSTVLPMFHMDIYYSFGNYGITLYTCILTYAILRHRVMDIHLIFKRTVVFSISVGVLAGLFLLFMMIMGRYLPDLPRAGSLNLFAISGLSVAVSCAILSLITLLFGKTKLHRLLLNFNIFVTIWGIGLFLVGIAESEVTAIKAWRFACFGGYLIAPCFFHLVRHFCEKKPGIMSYLVYLQGSVVSLACIVTDIMIYRTTYVFGLHFNVATPLYTAAMLLYGIVVILSYSELFRYLRKARGRKRLQTKYLIFGCIFGFAGAPISMFPMFNINIFYPFGNFGITLYAMIFTYAILRHHLMDLQLIFRRTMVYSLSAGLLTGLFLLLILIMSRQISDYSGYGSLWVSSIAALAIAVLFTPLKNRVQLFIDTLFYKTHYDYYGIIQKAGSDLVKLIRQRDIQDYILDLTVNTLKVRNAHFLSLDGGFFKGKSAMSSSSNGSNEELTKVMEGDSELVMLLTAGKNIVLSEELEEDTENDSPAPAAEEMKMLNGVIAVPFFTDGRLQDILVLEEKLSGDAYSDKDIKLLSTVSSQAAVSLKNAMLYDELEQRIEERTSELSRTNEKLRKEVGERRRSERELKRFAHKLEQSNRELDDFTKIVSHDLQEPLWKVKMFGDRLKAEYSEALGEKGREQMDIMYRSITRMQQLIKDLLALSRVTIGAHPSISVDLNRVVEEVLVDLSVRIEQVGGRVEAGHLPVINADPLQMRQLFQNLIGNALKFHSDERPPVIIISGRITEVAPKKADLDQAADKLCTIQVEDNGIGFDLDYLDYIFEAFQRLHGREEYLGTGMGLAICRKIVERHGGSITAKSTQGHGSIFIVTLPVSESPDGISVELPELTLRSPDAS